MSGQPDYFSNHALKLRFPWSLYHQPIVDALQRSFRLSPGPDVLNLGSGPFFELEQLEADRHRITVCDIDPRAMEVARELHAERVVGFDVIEPDAPLPYPDRRFDLVVSMDVIEHVPDPVPWAREALRVLKPGGLLFLTTPNYASRTLGLLEVSVLEAVARLQGFSRKHIHPTKMTPERLRNVLKHAGAPEVHTETLSLGWVLAAYVRAPQVQESGAIGAQLPNV